MKMNSKLIAMLLGALIIFTQCESAQLPTKEANGPRKQLQELNTAEIQEGTGTSALIGATVIAGEQGAIIENATVIISGTKITEVGPSSEVSIPDGAERIDLQGKYILPGLFDAHFHLGDEEMVTAFVNHGVTSVRDPGAWIETYRPLRQSGIHIPRLFLTGPHLDMYPPAYPNNSLLVRDKEEAAVAVNDFIAEGASAIKVYFRLPLGTIQTVCETAHAQGVPVTAHLEITNAKNAIQVGLDGIEHVTSFGTALIHKRDAEDYRKRVLADNGARRRGRYEVWNSINLQDTQYLNPLTREIVDHGTFISPNLAVFERQSDRGDSVEVQGFQHMMDFVGHLHRAGAKIVVGSHTWVPYSLKGQAYAREMELMVKSGMSAAAVIEGATILNAKFFRVEERLGSIEAGKLADVIVLENNPLEDITTMYNIERVMLNGNWVK